MSPHKLLSVVVIVSIGQVNSLHLLQEYFMKGTESHKPLRIYVYEDSKELKPNTQTNRKIITLPAAEDSDSRRWFSLSHNSSPSKDKVNVCINLFGIPIRFQISVAKAAPSWGGEAAINGEGYEANHQEEIRRFPGKELKQRVVSTAYAKNPATQTFPWKQDSRGAMLISDEPIRRNEKVSAGFQIFGVPIGLQFIYDKNDGRGPGFSELHSETVAETYSIATPILATIGKLAKTFVRHVILG